MPWLEKIDARASRWPVPAKWLYLGIRWYLIVLGGFCVMRLYLDRVGIWPLY
jgi:hypothetical protein